MFDSNQCENDHKLSPHDLNSEKSLENRSRSRARHHISNQKVFATHCDLTLLGRNPVEFRFRLVRFENHQRQLFAFWSQLVKFMTQNLPALLAGLSLNLSWSSE